jgi:hypothetical protein
MRLNDYGVPIPDDRELDDMTDFPPHVCRLPKPVERDPETRVTDRLATLLGIETHSARALVRDIIDATKEELRLERFEEEHVRLVAEKVSG